MKYLRSFIRNLFGADFECSEIVDPRFDLDVGSHHFIR